MAGVTTVWCCWCVWAAFSVALCANVERFSQQQGGTSGYHGKLDDVHHVPLQMLKSTERHDPSQAHRQAGTWFSWNDCGQPSSVVHVGEMRMTPDPLTSPGDALLVVNATLTTTLASPVEADVSLAIHKFGVWIPVPCPGCKFTNVCSQLSAFFTCPPKQGPLNLAIHFSIPPHLTTGYIRETVNFKSQGKWFGCFQVFFHLG
ncbi:ganglioside GM2 activator-like [Babylonia areolata]|uniref:ganglioside GM2 activator-like n=1 Tax=Babylonia areolata TaxID=304850 RepID=UPI003FCF3CFA